MARLIRRCEKRAPAWLARVAPAVLVALLCGSAAPSAAAQRVDLGDGMVAVLSAEGLYLEALPAQGEGLLALTRRLCGTTEASEAIAAINGGPRVLAGVRYRVPMGVLLPALQLRVIEALFPDDRREASGWVHQVPRAALQEGATLWSVAEWFTGRGAAFSQVREANRLLDDQLSAGQSLWIPAGLLLTSLRSALPPAANPAGAPLEFREGPEKSHAVYRLQPGEALYSSVVVRFTGRVYAEDVNAVAAEIAAASAISDVTDIPIGYEVKIDYELLLPEYLPAGHPRRQEYEATLADSSRFANRVQSRHLEGITVILDAGHGGKDVGASMAGVWESLYVYDVMLRTRALLEERTSARVVPTIRDGTSWQLVDSDVLPFSRGHQILTSPTYPIEDSGTGVNLRWYLANSVYRQAVDRSGDPEKVVFVSIHADSLHPSLRGAMVYVASAGLTAGRSGRTGVVYASRREVQERPVVEFSWRERTESEGLSRDLAEKTIAAFASAGLPVHPYKPVREKIIRQRSEFVPAVLRYNAVPAKMLVEVCNLANDQDRRLIQTRAFRQQVAEAIVAGILAYYGEDLDAGSQVQVAKARH
ncbi:MAG TPA: N-acetylmuramoyl-L-alanine amidase [Thermoanaerobaculia bacterium]|nr:N-acetylmuramoyl-L-alanine amidase [Thermoanaerobaculia bacterium]